MRKMKKVAVFTVLSVVAALGLAACGDTPAANTPVAATAVPTTAATAVMEPTTEPTTAVSEPTTAPTTEPTAVMEATTEPTAMISEPTAAATAGSSGGLKITGPGADLLNKYFSTFKDVKTYHSVTEVEVAGTTTKVETDFQAPDRSRSIIDTVAGKTETIIIGTDAYTKAPGMDQYVATQSPASMTDMMSATFLPLVDKADIVGDETIEGVDTTHLTFTYDAEQLAAGSGKVTVDVWVAKSTNYPVRQKVTTTGAAASTSTLTYSKINEPISPPIEKPTNIMQIPGMDIVTPVP
ncbi:MAG TPA: LppX_LprAFG lipoprotein [Chloroflexia bacterium]|nr:LppX_LprAFG lipoprotein [Chloroflexia bacterium]